MFVTFLRVQPAKKKGPRLDDVAACLAAANVNIRALDVDHDGIRVLADDPAAGMRALEAAGIEAERWEAYDLALEDRSGRLATLLDELERAEVGVAQVFGVSGPKGGHLFLRVDDMEAARPVFQAMRHA